MTTHVFIVNETTFNVHLQYLFAGTGAQSKDVDFNNSSTSALYRNNYAAEKGLVSMMADCCRIREGDYILFYVQATSNQEGQFFGVFQADGNVFLDKMSNPQFLMTQLGKNLTFRVRIRPYLVFEKGVSEWKALDEIRHIASPCQMLWSLIYRKLRANRGNTMITIYESERLLDLIRKENQYKTLPPSNSYVYQNGIVQTSNTINQYLGIKEPFNILPRLINKYYRGRAFEAHLQMYIVQNVGSNNNLDESLGIANNLEWIGNEVSCGVGMQRIDIMLSLKENELHRKVLPIELKATQVSSDIIHQINRYIDWIEQYYIPNRVSSIQPVIICRAGGLTPIIAQVFHSFNASGGNRYLPLKYIEFSINNNSIIFNNIKY